MNELTYIVLGLSVWNIFTFAIYGIDKCKAKNNKWRISEFTLITYAFLMGSVGALIGMRVFRHKTKHQKFIFLIPVSVIINIGVIVSYICFREKR